MTVAVARLPSLLIRLVRYPHSLHPYLSWNRSARYLPRINLSSYGSLDQKLVSTSMMEANNIAAPGVPVGSESAKRPLDEESEEITKSSEKKQKLDSREIAKSQDAGVEEQTGESSTVAEIKAPLEEKKKQSRKVARDKRNNDKDQRKRRGTRPDGEAAPDTGEPKAPRLPKRMSAMLLGFCGAGYSGMQVQRDVRTIEGMLFDVLVKIGAVSQDNADNPTKVSLNRAARTDAGVHAAGNVVSIKLITEIPSVPDIVARINEELPPEIRVWKILRVQNSFNARTICDSRKYTYYFPSYLLIPPKPGSGLQKVLSQHAGVDLSSHPFWQDVSEDSSPEEDLKRKRNWRAPPEAVEALRTAMKKYEGSHNFHNFTVGRDFNDRSTSRFMKKIEVTDPVVYGETEWISVLFHGQSFMLHQIRKMMAALVLICRTGTPAGIIDELYGPRMLFVPKMPALGLLLEYPIFESYNRRIASANGTADQSSHEYRPPVEFEPLREQMEQFKQEFIYSNMRSVEDRDGIFDAWVRGIDKYTGNDLLYLNPKGSIPAYAVIRKGERRENPFRERKRFDATSFPESGQKEVVDSEEEEEEEAKLDKQTLADMEG